MRKQILGANRKWWRILDIDTYVGPGRHEDDPSGGGISGGAIAGIVAGVVVGPITEKSNSEKEISTESQVDDLLPPLPPFDKEIQPS
ncbi:hypothetical protein BJV82DRAFT_710211 [Fennellomyces sp. T-0311]|nr:hypothetical protein BJV82DRAFT_710211 [Fennellomyces sp. T-0311]